MSFLILMVSLDEEEIPRFYRGKENERSHKKEGELYASPADVKTIQGIIA